MLAVFWTPAIAIPLGLCEFVHCRAAEPMTPVMKDLVISSRRWPLSQAMHEKSESPLWAIFSL